MYLVQLTVAFTEIGRLKSFKIVGEFFGMVFEANTKHGIDDASLKFPSIAKIQLLFCFDFDPLVLN